MATLYINRCKRLRKLVVIASKVSHPFGIRVHDIQLKELVNDYDLY
jgi:hypothetical protein